MKTYVYRDQYVIGGPGGMRDWFIGAPIQSVPGRHNPDDKIFWFGCARSEDHARQVIDALCDALGLPSNYGPHVPACERMLRK